MEILIVLALVLANGVFAGAEIAIISLRKTRLRELAQSGSASALAVEALRGRPERFLATVQVGITVIGATAAAFGGATIAESLTPVIARIPFLAPYASKIAVALVVVFVSYLSLVLGELVPKSLALRFSEKYSLTIARPLLWLSRVSRPIVWFLTLSSNLVLKAFGDRTSFTEARMSAEELLQMLEEAGTAGAIHPREGRIAGRAIEFGDLTVGDVMVPRQNVVTLARDATAQDIHRELLATGHQRMPVIGSGIDDVQGYVALRDVIELILEGRPFTASDVMRRAYFVPEPMKASALLAEFQRRRLQFAVVVDETGGTAGIVTVEDLVEELVGEITSEHGEAPPELMRREPDGTLWLNGTAPVRDVNRAYDLELPEEGDWSSVGGMCVGLLGAIPHAGTRIDLEDGSWIEVLDASPRRVRAVRLHPAPEKADS